MIVGFTEGKVNEEGAMINGLTKGKVNDEGAMINEGEGTSQQGPAGLIASFLPIRKLLNTGEGNWAFDVFFFF